MNDFQERLKEITEKIYDAELALRSAPDNESFNDAVDTLYDLRQEKRSLQAGRNKQIRQGKVA